MPRQLTGAVVIVALVPAISDALYGYDTGIISGALRHITEDSFRATSLRPRLLRMDKPSPGPGWWLASDGNWYPQRWEYYWLTRSNVQLGTAMQQAGEEADRLGQQGWEMVNSTVQAVEYRGARAYYQFDVVCFLKRPLAP